MLVTVTLDDTIAFHKNDIIIIIIIIIMLIYRTLSTHEKCRTMKHTIKTKYNVKKYSFYAIYKNIPVVVL